MKKYLSVLAAMVIAASMVTGCGNSSEDEGGNTTAAAQTQQDGGNAGGEETAPSLTAVEMADKLRADIEYVDQLNTISEDMIAKIYGITADKYTSAQVYVGGVSTAEEIACFDAVDETAAADIKAACEERIAAQIKSVESYNPPELEKLNDPVLVVKGSSVYMCLSNDNAKAKEIIG